MSKAPIKPPPKRPYQPEAGEFRQIVRESARNAIRHFQRSMTADGILSSLKTLAWLAPLTLLIWVYAERGQIDKAENQNIPIDVKCDDRNIYVRLDVPASKTIVAQLNGPKFRLDEIQRKIAPRIDQASVIIPIDRTLSKGDHELDTDKLLLSSPAFYRSGVTITDCKPPKIKVFVDEYQEVEVDVQAPPSMKNLSEAPTFTPAKVTIRAPKSSFKTMPVVYADLASSGDTTKPGAHEATVRITSDIQGDAVSLLPDNRVKAKFVIKSLVDETDEIRNVVVWVSLPLNLQNKVRVICDTPALQNVPVSGPADQLALLKQDPPRARLDIPSSAQLGAKQQGKLTYQFPAGAKDVHLGDSAPTTVEYSHRKHRRALDHQTMQDPRTYVETLARDAKRAAGQLAALPGAIRSQALLRIAAAIRQQRDTLIQANAKDIAAAQEAGLASAFIERLKLNEKRIESMAAGVEQIAAQVDPVGQTIEGYVRPNGLRIEKRRVPIGVVLFFYESRPNVTSDAAALCIKSGNAIILRGGKEAIHSNMAIASIIASALKESNIDPAAVQLVESTDRALVPIILKLDTYIDLVIPRGGENLIRAVVADSTIPVLKHFTGNCHLYVDASAGAIEQQVRDICVNAKTSYPGGAVCNAVEHILFHKDVAQRLLPVVCADLAAKGVEIRADFRAHALYPQATATTPEDWATEYLAFIVGIKIVDSLDQAIQHINEYGSHHTDGILSTSISSINEFVTRVDSASVMVNASTRFADGGEYGLGAEIGISTDKLHARGPMGASDLTTYKWVVTGNGHVR